MLPIDTEHGERFAVDVRIPQASRLDDGADVIALWSKRWINDLFELKLRVFLYFSLQLSLQLTRGTPFSHLTEAIGCDSAVFPDTIIGAVRRSDDVAEMCQPLVGWKVFGMRVPRPQTLEHDLIGRQIDSAR